MSLSVRAVLTERVLSGSSSEPELFLLSSELFLLSSEPVALWASALVVCSEQELFLLPEPDV